MLNVGVVGDFLELLALNTSLSLHATDYYPAIAGRKLHGAYVRDGKHTLDEVSEADVAIVTGMTLATNTLDDILRVAQENGTHVLLFAETGANFADVYLENGVSTVVAEPFPFYLSGAPSCTVRVHRAKD